MKALTCTDSECKKKVDRRKKYESVKWAEEFMNQQLRR